MKVALITGAGSGIGRRTAITFVKAGYRVAVAGRRQAPLEETLALAGAGENGIAIAADVGDPAAVQALFDTIEARWNRLDVLFNNAGNNAGGPIEEFSFERWQAVLAANLTGPFLCTQAAFRLMKRQTPHGGRIINNGSIAAHSPRPNSAPYTATKHAITGLTKSTSLDGRKYDIACGQIDIGNALTEMSGRMLKGVPQADGRIEPEAMMDVQHVADAVLAMANLPLETNVQFMTIMATKMPFIGRG